ncbi:hypothetical protein CTI14_49280, partial [Methylobacterium radiotolerans]
FALPGAALRDLAKRPKDQVNGPKGGVGRGDLHRVDRRSRSMGSAARLILSAWHSPRPLPGP